MIRAIARILRHRLSASGIAYSLKRLRLLAVLVVVLMGGFVYTRAYIPARVLAATSSTLNFQARLMSNTGTLVPDGSYSIQFKLYTAASGGTNEWTETQPTVTVRNGYLSVQLGSVTSFSGIDWSQEKWLTMNVSGDGEMNPRIKLTATPYSFRAGQADTLTNGSGTLTADDLLQKAPLVIQSVNANVAGLRFNQTGTGGLLQLQGDGADIFTVSKAGNAVLAGTLDINGSSLDIGSASLAGGLILNDGSSNTGTLQTSSLAGNQVYTLPDASGVVCLDTGNCLGGSSGGANTALSNLVSTSINQSLIANVTNSLDLGSSGVTWRNGYFGTGIQAPQVTSTGILTLTSGGSGALILDSASNTLVFNDDTWQRSSSSLTLDINNAGLSTFSIVNNNGSNVANLDVEGAIVAGSGNAFSVNSSGDVTSVFTALNGTSTANGSAVLASTSLTLNDASNFDVGNYVQINSANCGGTGINPCYSKITAKSTNTLTITPALTWASGSTVNEYHVPEIGGTNTTSALANRYGRGYFIAGVATGNGTTYYEDGAINSSLGTFNLLSSGVTTLNVGSAGTTVSVLGNFQTAASQTITAGGGLTVASGGASISGGLNNNSGGITNAGSIAGATTLSLSGAITGATTVNTINGLIINSGALSGITGITFTSGGLNLNSGGITNSGSITGVGTNVTATAGLTIASGGSSALTLDSASNTLLIAANDTSMQRTAAGSYTIDLNDGSATTLVLNNSGVGAANLNLQDGTLQVAGTTVLTNGRALQNLTGLSSGGPFTSSGGTVEINVNSNFATNINTGTSTGTVSIGGGSMPLVINSTNFDVSSAGALSGITTIGMSGAITAATATNTINGLIINSGALSGVSGYSQTSGTFTISGSGAINIGGGSNALTINSTNFDVSSAGALSGITTISASGNINTTGVYQRNGASGIVLDCNNGQYVNQADISGGIITSGSCASIGLSDQRLKKNVVPLDDNVLEKIRSVNTVGFDFKCNQPEYANSGMDCFSGRQTGVIAQEMANIFPDLVYQDENGYYNVKYQGLSIYTLKAVTELAADVEARAYSSTQQAKEVKTGGVLRLSQAGELQNITGLRMVSGGVSVIGGIDNNGGGITEAGVISGATTVHAEALLLNANGTDNLLELKKDNKGVFTVFNSGALELKLSADKAFAVKDKDSKDYFSINTNGGLVQIGSAAADEKTVLLVLDSKATEGDPEGVNGAQYYNAKTNKFRCFQDGKWQDCLPVTNAEYVIVPQATAWQQPVVEQEFPGSPRVWVDMTRARNFRVMMQLKTGGASAASCFLQYATSDNGPWKNLAQPGGYMDINSAGSLKSEWSAITPEARSEILVRLMCRGGNFDGNNATTAAKPEFGSIRLQIR